MIRLTEPIQCPRCRRLVVPGEDRWYDLLDDYTAGPVHVCGGDRIDGDESAEEVDPWVQDELDRMD